MLCWDIPDRPWQELATDDFTFNGRKYLQIVGTFIKYPFIHRTHSKTFETLIQSLQDLISQDETPKQLFTDNRPQFLPETFAKFLSLQNMNHITSSPSMPSQVDI